MHDPWTDRLSEYLDGDLAPGEAEMVEAHLAGCPACRDTLAGLRALARGAAALEDRGPASDLWPRIRDGIRGEAVPHTAAGDARVLPLLSRNRPARRFSFSVPQLLAAGIAMMAISGLAVRFALGTGTTPPAPVAVQSAAPAAPGSLGPEAAVLISSVEQEYGQAIEGLEREFAARRDRLDPETARVVEESLRAIDEAIAEARAALARDPANGYLYRHLDNTMTKKVDLLRRAAGATLVST